MKSLLRLKAFIVLIILASICSVGYGQDTSQEPPSPDWMIEQLGGLDERMIGEFERASQAGSLEATWALMMYYSTAAVIEIVPSKVFKYAKALAQLKDAQGITLVKEMGIDSINVMSGPQAFDMLVKQGDHKGFFWQGVCYRYGYGVEVNIPKAISLFKKAVGIGSFPSLYELALIYYHGLSGKKALGEAYQYLTAYTFYYPRVYGVERYKGILEGYLEKISGNTSWWTLRTYKKQAKEYINLFGKLMEQYPVGY